MKKPFTVAIEETYHRTVVILAEDKDDAERVAGSLCDSGEIDLERNCFAGRTVFCYGESSEEEKKLYDSYEE